MLFVAANTEMGERLRAARLKTRLTMTAFADVLGVPRSTYKNWEYGVVSNIDPAIVLKAESLVVPELSAPTVPAPLLLVPIPYIGKVAASSPVDWTDPFESETMEEVPPQMAGRGRFSATIFGDSMYDLLLPNDVVVFQAHDVPIIGNVVLYRSEDSTVTIKTLKHNGKGFILHPENPNYEDCEATGTMVGYLVGIIRKHHSREVTVYDPSGIRP